MKWLYNKTTCFILDLSVIKAFPVKRCGDTKILCRHFEFLWKHWEFWRTYFTDRVRRNCLVTCRQSRFCLWRVFTAQQSFYLTFVSPKPFEERKRQENARRVDARSVYMTLTRIYRPPRESRRSLWWRDKENKCLQRSCMTQSQTKIPFSKGSVSHDLEPALRTSTSCTFRLEISFLLLLFCAEFKQNVCASLSQPHTECLYYQKWRNQKISRTIQA